MSKRIETAKQYIANFASLDGEAFTRLKTTDCLHYFAPASIGITGAKTNQEFAEHMVSLQRVLKGFPVHVKELWDGGSHVTVWATSETQFRPEAMDEEAGDWAFRGEYVFVLDMNEAGDRITKVMEFLDSKKTEELRGLMGRAKRNLGQERDVF